MKVIDYIGHPTLAILILLVSTMILTTCERRPLEYDELPSSARFDVKIDWSMSGIIPEGDNKDVHRVSFRFFPKNKQSQVFDRYLEGKVTEGKIDDVPLGKFSVIVFNESVDDHWEGVLSFTDINSYDDFAANAVFDKTAPHPQKFPFYKPLAGEKFIVEPLKLASWSIKDFEVTENMILVMQGARPSHVLSDEETEMVNAFTNVVMRALTRPVNLTANVENVVSAQATYMAMRGFASKVYMASGRTTNSAVSYLFTLGKRTVYSDGKNGALHGSFQCFGRVSSGESYQLAADVLFGTGELYKPTPPLLFDVTNQVIPNYNTKVPIDLSIQFNLPFVEGGISVEDWDDEVYTLE